ncbi:MAG: hypothetical protein AAF961_16330, partial [Planctomycetota bacterium]
SLAVEDVPRPNGRRPASEGELRRWLENMAWHHRFTRDEMASATGLSAGEIEAALRRFDIRADNRPRRARDAPLLVLPYPGGRHPRIGFLEGAVRPQRETKVSVFAPWDDAQYVVLDVPEAIWWDQGKRELLYLAHTHVPTTWTKRSVELPPTEWQVNRQGELRMRRTLPNGVAFGTRIRPSAKSVQMEMRLHNGTSNTLRDLDVQACVLLKGAPPLAELTNDNKVFSKPYAACGNADRDRWVVTAWAPCQRVWGNERCPCMHSDPRFPDCDPGETVRLSGWLSFYEGTDVRAELQRIDMLPWREGLGNAAQGELVP